MFAPNKTSLSLLLLLFILLLLLLLLLLRSRSTYCSITAEQVICICAWWRVEQIRQWYMEGKRGQTPQKIGQRVKYRIMGKRSKYRIMEMGHCVSKGTDPSFWTFFFFKWLQTHIDPTKILSLLKFVGNSYHGSMGHIMRIYAMPF